MPRSGRGILASPTQARWSHSGGASTAVRAAPEILFAEAGTEKSPRGGLIAWFHQRAHSVYVGPREDTLNSVFDQQTAASAASEFFLQG